MTNELYSPINCHIEIAKTMASWRHGDAVLAVGDIIAPDEFDFGVLVDPVAIAEPIGRSSSYLRKYRTNRYRAGRWVENYKLITARLLAKGMGKVATTEGSPNTHDISIRTSQTPYNEGRHLERENETSAESERLDLLGLLCSDYHVECSEEAPIAIQRATWDIAKILNSTDDSTNDITKPADLTEEPFRWENFTFPTFTYNSETIECDILGWAFDIRNRVRAYKVDSDGFFTKGKMGIYEHITTTLTIEPYGSNPFELKRTRIENYITDLDLTVKCARNATDDYIQWTHDKMYAMPWDIRAMRSDEGFERYEIAMHQLNTGSIAIQAKDDYNDDHYENP